MARLEVKAAWNYWESFHCVQWINITLKEYSKLLPEVKHSAQQHMHKKAKAFSLLSEVLLIQNQKSQQGNVDSVKPSDCWH